jgi:hypothetical protein
MKAQRGADVQLYSFFNLGATWRWVVIATLRLLYPQERGAVPIVEAGWPQGRSGRVQKISPPLGFDPRTIQPVRGKAQIKIPTTD